MKSSDIVTLTPVRGKSDARVKPATECDSRTGPAQESGKRFDAFTAPRTTVQAVDESLASAFPDDDADSKQ